MNPTTNQPRRFAFVGGHLCLDFANTVGGSRKVVPHEHLHGYADLVSWSQQARIVDEARVRRIKLEAGRRPARATSVFKRAISLREAIYRIFSSRAAKEAVTGADLAVLNEELSGALVRSRIVGAGEGFAWDRDVHEGMLEQPLWPIAESAAELLTSSELLREIRECDGDSCGWLFLDTTRNHSRRWCDMRDCGTRAKVRRHRARKNKSGRR